MNKNIEKIKEHLMVGVSNMIPYVIMGGILTAIYIATKTIKLPVEKGFLYSFSNNIAQLGKISFSLMIPVLAGYIAYSIGGMSALAPAIVAGFFSDTLKLGFFGGIIVGFLSGYLANLINKINFPPQLKILMPIFIVPMLTIIGVSSIMYYLLGVPIQWVMNFLENFLRTLSSQNTQFLIIVLATMIAFDMGGPVNKAAYLFSVSMLSYGRFDIMGAVAVAICIPPISLGITTYLFKNQYNEIEKEVGKAAIVMGVMGITEGALPFAVMSPIKIISSNIVGAVTGALFAINSGVKNLAPHGGIIILPVVENKIMYVVSILFGVGIQILFLILFNKISQIASLKYKKIRDI